MPEATETESRKLLGRLRDTMASDVAGQARLDKITHLIADSMGTEVCSIYLFRDEETLELCATEGLKPESVHQTRMRLGEGLVGRVARTGEVMNTPDAPAEKGFRYMPETGEERFSSFMGVPIQRLGESLGVLVVQSRDARHYSADEVYALEVVAMVLAEMTELGAFTGDGNEALPARHQQPVLSRGRGRVARRDRSEWRRQDHKFLYDHGPDRGRSRRHHARWTRHYRPADVSTRAPWGGVSPARAIYFSWINRRRKHQSRRAANGKRSQQMGR